MQHNWRVSLSWQISSEIPTEQHLIKRVAVNIRDVNSALYHHSKWLSKEESYWVSSLENRIKTDQNQGMNAKRKFYYCSKPVLNFPIDISHCKGGKALFRAELKPSCKKIARGHEFFGQKKHAKSHIPKKLCAALLPFFFLRLYTAWCRPYISYIFSAAGSRPKSHSVNRCSNGQSN